MSRTVRRSVDSFCNCCSFMGTLGELHRVLKFVFNGKLKPVVDRVFPMQEIAAAHRYLENKEQFGKVVVVP